MERVLNIGLRLVTLGARFLFVFFLARFLTPEAVGYYGLFTAAVGYAIYFVGLDFYVYMTREILAASIDQRGSLIKGQILLSAMLYLAILPMALFLLDWIGWPASLLWWFVPVLILEHLNQEIYRLLIAISRQTLASLLLFVRQGSWAVTAVVLMIVLPETRHLDLVLALWVVAGVIAAASGAWALSRVGMGGWRRPVSWSWVVSGIRVSLAFLAATLALRGIQTVDRYWIEAISSIETVGAYVLFFGVASALMVFLDAGVFAFAYPDLIQLAKSGSREAMHARMRMMCVQVVGASVGFGAISWLVLPFLLNWIGHSLYLESLELYPWLLLATALNALGLVPHYALYACKCDRTIVLSHLSGVVIFVISGWSLKYFISEKAIPAALCITFFIIFIWKALAWLLLGRNKHEPVVPAIAP